VPHLDSMQHTDRESEARSSRTVAAALQPIGSA
jgi:hypothetical protein